MNVRLLSYPPFRATDETDTASSLPTAHRYYYSQKVTEGDWSSFTSRGLQPWKEIIPQPNSSGYHRDEAVSALFRL